MMWGRLEHSIIRFLVLISTLIPFQSLASKSLSSNHSPIQLICLGKEVLGLAPGLFHPLCLQHSLFVCELLLILQNPAVISPPLNPWMNFSVVCQLRTKFKKSQQLNVEFLYFFLIRY
jgi:hypothetical protein